MDTEVDTAQEAAPSEWQTFDDDQMFLSHILSKKPAEKLVEVPEWGVKVLCRGLNAESRIEVERLAYDSATKTSNFLKVSDLVVMYGCYNPMTGNRVFKEAHKEALSREQDGGAVTRLAITILRLSRMIASDAENAKKN